MKKISFFGDSICTGFGVSIHKGWVTRLAREFDGRATIANCSANGRTTRQALEAMPYEIQQHPPDILVVQFGLNDGNCWKSDRGLPRVSALAFEANLREIVDRAYKFGVEDVVLLTNHRIKHKPILEYNQLIRDVARRNAILVDIWEATFGNKNVLQDGVHLSEEGHGIYYATVKPVLEELL
jgi:lysophospholipase L1-like esterase